MDISKASNFERFVFDMVKRDSAQLRALWQTLAREGGFDLSDKPAWNEVSESGFISGRSTHVDRIATIREVHRRYGVMIDPHTADGVKVAQEVRGASAPMICIETALPAKFAATLLEALGVDPGLPPSYADLLQRKQHRTIVPIDSAKIKAFIGEHALTA